MTNQQDFQKAFIQAITEREVSYTVVADTFTRTLLVKRWNLTQSLRLGDHLARIVNSLITMLSALQPKDGKPDAPPVDIDVLSYLKSSSVMAEVMSSHEKDIITLLNESLINNFANMVECKEFVQTLDVSQAIELLMFIGSINLVTTTAKKKLVEQANLLRSPPLPE